MSAKTADKKIVVEQFRSAAGRNKKVKLMLHALGLGRIGKKKELPANEAVLGMVEKVSYMVRIAK